MEKEIHVTYERIEGVVSINFKLQNPMVCSLSFSSDGRVLLEIPERFSDDMRQFGLQMLFADELKVDLTKLEVNLAAPEKDGKLHARTSQDVVNSVRRLCLCANLYFKDRAAFYWGVLSSQCRVTNMHVLSHRYKIAYKQLIEIDSVLFNNMPAQ
jgi:hypothetical protein